MTPRVRKFALTAHVTASVGWLGAVAGFLALAVAGAAEGGTDPARSVYPAMEVLGRYVIVPLALATPLTGLVSSLGTHWGLVRHYWVVVKLWLTVPATLLLLAHMRPVIAMADGTAGHDLGGLRTQFVTQGAAALLVLLGATALSVYKPAGRTRRGTRITPAPRHP
ncbi:hypothetical protein ACWF94_20640 [Streptomyces sp. NPDC055078]